MKDLILYYETKIYLYENIIKELNNILDNLYNNGDRHFVNQRIKEIENLKETYSNDLMIIQNLGDKNGNVS